MAISHNEVIMKNKDIRSLKVLTDWKNREYKNEGQKAASLQCLINSALEEQHYLTRVACADAVLMEYGPDAANTCVAVRVE